MPDYPFEAVLVVDENLNEAPNSQVVVYDANDTSNSTPLALKDMSGLPLPNPITTTSKSFAPPLLSPAKQIKYVEPLSGLTVVQASFTALSDEANGAKSAAETAAAAAAASAADAAAARALVEAQSGGALDGGNASTVFSDAHSIDGGTASDD